MPPIISDKPTSAYGLSAIWEEASKVHFEQRREQVQHLLLESWRTLRASPLTSILSWATISTALFVLSFFVWSTQNLGEFLRATSKELTVSAFMRESLEPAERDRIFQEISQYPEVLQVDFLSKAQALDKFKARLGSQPELAAGMEQDNPLPASYEISLKPMALERYEVLLQDLAQIEGIEAIGQSQGLLKQLNSLIDFVRSSGTIIILVLLLITGVTIVSTIRLALLERHDELSIMRLVGAASWYVRIPCILEGIFHGLIGSVTALICLRIFYSSLLLRLGQVPLLGELSNELSFLSFGRIVFIVATGIIVGSLASYLAVWRLADD